MDNYYEIYFSDLNKQAQRKFLNFLGIKTPEEANYDTFPIAIIYKDNIFGNK